MKVIPINLQAHYDTGSATIADAIKITRTDAAVYAFTSHDRKVPISGVEYLPSGLSISSLEISSGFAVGNLNIETIDDGTVFSKAEILARVWSDATFELFRFNWADPADGIEDLLTGTIGEVNIRQGKVVAELRDLRQRLQQPIGQVSLKTCRARLADFPTPAAPNILCRLLPSDWTVTGTVTSVTSAQVFTDTGRTEATGWFDEGVLTWTSGNNGGLSQKVKTFAADVFTLSLPMLQAIAIGNTYSVIAGCRKRLTEDCKTKFNNVLNFQGEPHRPTVDEVSRSPTFDA